MRVVRLARVHANGGGDELAIRRPIEIEVAAKGKVHQLSLGSAQGAHDVDGGLLFFAVLAEKSHVPPVGRPCWCAIAIRRRSELQRGIIADQLDVDVPILAVGACPREGDALAIGREGRHVHATRISSEGQHTHRRYGGKCPLRHAPAHYPCRDDERAHRKNHQRTPHG